MELNNSATTTATYSQIDLEDKEQAVPQAHAVAVLGVPHVKAVPKVEVVAPADLAGGYQFTVDLNGRVLLVSVPDGGVSQGQSFQATVVSEVDHDRGGPHDSGRQAAGDVPVGGWRDGLCDCCSHGCCHPTCCLSFWCPSIALGQVMTRSGLNWLGDPLENSSHKTPPAYSTGWSAFKILLVMTIAMVALNQFLVIIIAGARPNYYGNDPSQPVLSPETPIWVIVTDSLRQVLMGLFGLYFLVVTIKTRGLLRRRHAVPGECGHDGVDDCCLSFWCRCCVVAQMLRHTADYSHQKAACCTETGLAHDQHIV
jgi:Cys-rich protein (TIGR01571 family)